MARIHILRQVGSNTYEAVVHEPTPAGNNSAGVPWATAIKNAGIASTVMTQGSGAGQISVAEANSIIAGNTLEGQFHFQDDPNWTATERNTQLDHTASQAIADLVERYRSLLRWFGATRT